MKCRDSNDSIDESWPVANVRDRPVSGDQIQIENGQRMRLQALLVGRAS
jgi:hypothetical protein